MRRFIEPLSVYAHIKSMIFKRFVHFFNQSISTKENNIFIYSETIQGVVEATRIIDLTAWPLHDNNDRIDFGNSDVEFITTYFNGIQ